MTDDLILGIETSCDDTAAAVVAADGTVLSSVVMSQTELHALWGGVYPELASRAHVAAIIPAVARALDTAAVEPTRLRAIAVTRGPGLIGSLLVGLNTAVGLGLGWGVPVIGINHLRGHLRSADLEETRVRFPALVLLVSGGHTFLAHMADRSTVTLLGSTRDDSVGESYDKVARMLGLGYPGGPAIDRMAGDRQATLAFPRPLLNEGLEFSFSGLKSSVARHLERSPQADPREVAASFVAATLEVLMTKCRRALESHPAISLVIVGGVAASPQLRTRAAALCQELGIALCLPPLRWATDNAAMIGLAAFDYLELGLAPPPVPQLGLRLAEF